MPRLNGERARCGECNARIIWGVTKKNDRPIPLNPEWVYITYSPAGKVMGIDAEGEARRGNLCQAGTDGSIAVRVAHFATCAARNHGKGGKWDKDKPPEGKQLTFL